MMLTDLADVLRAAGLNVVEQPGWKTRSNDGNRFAGVWGILCHWTGTALAANGDYPSLNIVTNGRSDLPGMLSQLGLGRNGTWYVIGAGVAWHAGTVDRTASDNYHAIGIEAEYHPDQGAWPEVQQRSYERGCAALAEHYGVPLDQIRGHYEAAKPYGRKPDPKTLPGGMPGFRQRVAAVNLQEEDDLNAEESEWLGETHGKVLTHHALPDGSDSDDMLGHILITTQRVRDLAENGVPTRVELTDEDRAAIVADLAKLVPSVDSIAAAVVAEFKKEGN